jgi:ribA/ribD-fused uncharacterized protein
MKTIDSFSGSYRFLSNFWLIPIRLGGVVYPSTEHAYQAAKTLDNEARAAIAAEPSPGRAKRLGSAVALRDDWEAIKVDVMLACLRQKFSRPDLREKLLSTGDTVLVEGNHWGDTFWGVCRGVGENTLGRLLMQVRDELRP